MPIDHTSHELILAAVLQNSDKIAAMRKHALRADDANYNRRRLSITNGVDFDDTEEARLYANQTEYMESTLGPTLEGLFASHRASLESDSSYFGLLDADVPTTQEDKNADDSAIDYIYDPDLTDGTITILKRIGRLGALRRQMQADAETVTANAISFGTFTANNANTGVLGVTSMTGESHAPTSTLILECTDETIDAPKFAVSLEMNAQQSLPDGTTVIEADNEMTIGKSFQDGPTGLTMLLAISGLAAPTEAGDDLAMFSSPTFATQKEADMNGGVLQVKVTRQSSNVWLIEMFNSSDRDVKVGSATTTGVTGTFSGDVTLANDTRFTFSFDRAAAHSGLSNSGDTDNNISFDIVAPREGDRWTRTVTNDEAGNANTKLMRLWRASLPTSGSPTYSNANFADISVT